MKDRVDSNNMSINYCRTGHMLSDLFNKALHGALFVKLCEVIMGCKQKDNLYMGPPSTKEHVGNMDKVKYIK